MNHARTLEPALWPDSLSEAVETASECIAPCWPLDQQIAVNPYWGWLPQTFEAVGGQLAQLAGSPLQMAPDYYLRRYAEGEISDEHLRAALAESGSSAEVSALLGMDAAMPPAPALPLLSDVLDTQATGWRGPLWRDSITQQLTQFCAAWFDRNQADWQPTRDTGLYAAWRTAMAHDHSVAVLMQAPAIRQRAARLPPAPEALLAHAVNALDIPASRLVPLFQRLLLSLGGWAAWCAYLRWQARLVGKDDPQLLELLAVLLAWQCLLDDGDRGHDSAWHAWQTQWSAQEMDPPKTSARAAQVWQRAQEIAYQQPLARALLPRAEAQAQTAASCQAVFCIDVRSEVFRRALEAADNSIETRGFAGFFGLPLAYTPLGTTATQPLLPGLLAPSLTVTDSCGRPEEDRSLAAQRKLRLAARASLGPFQRLPGSAFTQVEALGLGYLGKLLQRSLGLPRLSNEASASGLRADEARRLHPALSVAPAARIALAAQVLTAMGLTQRFAPLVLLAGHGSVSANNPHAAGLHCGACGGQTGEVSARSLSGLLNDPAVRQGLAAQEIHIPDTTCFVAGLHNTTTDELRLLDRELVPASHLGPLLCLEQALTAAGASARAERAAGLGLGHLRTEAPALLASLQARSRDWAETRPEWGLANNAAFIVAPRARTRGLNLQGRAFLHDYHAAQDPDGQVLELIMTAPMVVTNWINLQYYASTVDPQRYGSGNKILHNVVGGKLGVFEGNGGDLRIGLPWQSVHDGEQWRHAPVRLSVFIEAPQAAIERVLAKHLQVRQLVEHEWLHLFRLGDAAVERRHRGAWSVWARADVAQ